MKCIFEKNATDSIDSHSVYTKRTTVNDIEAILYKSMPVLDHGFIRVIDYMGDDSAIAQAARVSYGEGTKRISSDEGLLRYLMSHQHTSPFEMCEIKMHIKMPIFVARQWIRHRMASVNEYSARYSLVKNDFYLPEKSNIKLQSVSNNQGRDDSAKVSEELLDRCRQILHDDAKLCHEHYQSMIDHNIARELARMNLTLNCYTEWYWKIDLHNLLNFLNLRVRSNAQWEIREYALIILNNIVKKWVPTTYRSFLSYRLDACHISAEGMKVIKRMIKGEQSIGSADENEMSKREWSELMSVLEIDS